MRRSNGWSPTVWAATPRAVSTARSLRRFHGLLVAALPAPIGRVLLLHPLQETVRIDGAGPDSTCGPGRDHGSAAIAAKTSVSRRDCPTGCSRVNDGARIEQSLMMPHDQNTVHVRYRLTGAAPPATLVLRPWLDFRPHEGSRRIRGAATARTARGPARFEFRLDGAPAALRMTAAPTRRRSDAAEELEPTCPIPSSPSAATTHRARCMHPGRSR